MTRNLRLAASRTLLSTIAAATLCSGPAFAEVVSPLDRGWIDEGATWLIHLDVERFLASELGKVIVREIEEQDAGPAINEPDAPRVSVEVRSEVEPGADAPQNEKSLSISIGGGSDRGSVIDAAMPGSLREFRERFGFDPIRDVLSITVAGDEAGDQPDTVLIHTTAAIDNAVKELQAVEGLDIEHLNGVTVGRFQSEDASEPPTLIAVRPEPDGTRMMFIAESVEGLAEVLKPGGTSDGPAWADPAPDAFLYLHALHNSPLFVEADRSHLLKGAQSVELNLGQRGDQFFVVGDLRTENAEVAAQLAAMANGLIAFARLGAMSQDAEPEVRRAMDMLQGLTLTTREQSVHLEFQTPAGALVDFLELSSTTE